MKRPSLGSVAGAATVAAGTGCAWLVNPLGALTVDVPLGLVEAAGVSAVAEPAALFLLFDAKATNARVRDVWRGGLRRIRAAMARGGIMVLLPSVGELREAITEAAGKHAAALGREIIDEQAVPSYLYGWWLSRQVFWGKLRPIVRATAPRDGQTILDFGCGTGILLPTWVGNGARVWATDLHLEMAQSLARRLKLEAVRFVPATRWAEEIPNGSLDTIVAANVLEHVEDGSALYSTFLRKLAPRGRLVVSGPTENVLYRLGRTLIGFSGHYHVTTIADVLREVEAAGFRPVWQRRYPVPGPACLYRIASFAPANGAR